ncbi:uncharacterized protein KZ484_022583 isoform 2-T3 [Pholidichthys leucotaenia]
MSAMSASFDLSAMSASALEDTLHEDFQVGEVQGVPMRPKPRFSFKEVKLLLEAVKRNRYVILKKLNQGVSAETKKQTWTQITNEINGLGENHREVRQIMKKWADLKCDAKRRIAALRGENSGTLRKKRLTPVERMVHKILMMGPGTDVESDLDFFEDGDFSNLYSKSLSPTPSSYSYISVNDGSYTLPGDITPLSSPDKDVSGDPFHSSSEFDLADGDPMMDLDDSSSSVFSSYPPPGPSSSSVDPLPEYSSSRTKPFHTYSRNQNQNHSSSRPTPPRPPPPGPSSSSSVSPAPPPPPPRAPVSEPLPPARAASSSTSSDAAPRPRPPSSPSSSCGPRERLDRLASQSVEQQRASRVLLSSVSRSLESLAQSVQLLVESQQELVQESLKLQREALDVLRDFSSTALTMLRDRGTGQLNQQPYHHQQQLLKQQQQQQQQQLHHHLHHYQQQPRPAPRY